MNFDTVIFDLDGTLLNTIDDLTDSVNYALNVCGFPTRSVDEIRGFVGNGIRRTLKRAAPENTSDEIQSKMYRLFGECYLAHCADKTRPYDGITGMLKKLNEHGIKSAIVSNKSDAAVKKLSDIFFGGLISAAAGDCDSRQRKPAPDSVFYVMEQLGSGKSSCIYCGDSEVDIMTAANAGIPCISAAWGFKGRAFLEKYNAEMIADTPADIFRYII